MTSSSLRLDGRTAVVLGGTGGIGRAISLGLGRAGADVIACGRGSDRVEQTACEIESLGRRTLRATCDVTDRGSLERLLEAVVSAFGKVDVLVNGAGKIARGATVDFDERQWAEILDTNLTGMLRSCQIFGRNMLERGYGRIVNVASLTAAVAFFEVAAYGASKAGVVALTRSLAVEWASKGVCVNAIAPGVFRTTLNESLLDGTERGRELLMRTPAARFGQPEELVGAAVFLASEAASFVNGQLLVVDGGLLSSGVNR